MDKRFELTPQQIAQKYVDEIITDEYLMNIGEIRDLDAISWFDETYPKNPIRKKQSCSIAFSNASRTTTSLRQDSYWMNITNAINHKILSFPA